MKQIYGFLLFLWLAVEMIMKQNVDLYGIAYLLGALCLFIIIEKYFSRGYASAVFLPIAILLSRYNSDFIILAGISLMGFAWLGNLALTLAVSAVSLYFCIDGSKYGSIFSLLSAALFGYVTGLKVRNEEAHLSTLDEERRLRYNLEKAQRELLASRREIEHMTEVRERNRIAHEIHDNIGHGIAGVIFQLEAARRMIKKDTAKTEDILKLCSDKLSEALELTRNTVHNIRTDKSHGIEAIEKLLGNFKFCPVSFEHSGDFGSLSASGIKLLETNIMECLTNASKYSSATDIHIKIDIGKRNIRLYYKDNGIGCQSIKEGLGLMGMRERVRNTGGTISIDGRDGFLIVCNIPKESDGEEVLF